jgi:hypothetical protein
MNAKFERKAHTDKKFHKGELDALEHEHFEEIEQMKIRMHRTWPIYKKNRLKPTILLNNRNTRF